MFTTTIQILIAGLKFEDTMIRRYKLNSRLPKAKLLKLIDDFNPYWRTLNTAWMQMGLCEPGIVVDAIREWFVQQCPIKHKEHAIVIIHRIIGHIPRHTDCMSRSCFLFPIKIGKNVWLGVEDKEVKLELGNMYRFNDYRDHYLASSTCSVNILVTVDFTKY